MTYTFNGKGEFVLVRADTVRHRFDAQARFEAVPNNVYGTSRATVLTAVAGKIAPSAQSAKLFDFQFQS